MSPSTPPSATHSSRPSWRRTYDAYLFDLDGTLADTAPDLHAALNHALAKVDINPVSIELTRHWVGHGARKLIEAALTHHNTALDLDQQLRVDDARVLEDFLDFYGSHIAVHSLCYPTVEATLETLHEQGAKLAVVTNKIAALSEPLIEALGIAPYFDLVISGDSAAKPKPDPAPVHLCLDRLGVRPEHALFIGDSETDVNAAKAAGVAVVCLRDGYNHGIDVADLNPDGVIELCSEILSV